MTDTTAEWTGAEFGAREMAPPRDVIEVTAANFADATRGLDRSLTYGSRFAMRLPAGVLTVRYPDGRWLRFRGATEGPSGVVLVHDSAFVRRLARDGDIGVAEAFIAGEWSSPDVTAFLTLFAVNYDALEDMLGRKSLFNLGRRLLHWWNENTRRGARRNIRAHYDLGNAFYAAWLDPTMTYSSAIFEAGETDLSAAQTAKYRSLAERIGLAPSHSLLEIGCGWGGFAEFAARDIGCRVVGLTISDEQFDYARARIHRAGLTDRVEIKLQDYRDETGRYDRIASIEMIEAVGEKYWPTYFGKLAETLKPGGAAGIQAITIAERYFDAYRRQPDFIQRYIFPGGMLPTATILRELGDRFGMPFVSERRFGEDYARTLGEWHRRFSAAWPSIRQLGFNERFRRIWEYYLHYCAAGFLSRNIDVRQMVFARG